MFQKLPIVTIFIITLLIGQNLKDQTSQIVIQINCLLYILFKYKKLIKNTFQL
jgi:hypothetical protein